ncbi:MAG: phosphate ABC transporter permease subunit PstC [Actinobacteria bacterium]|nr:phosphate ABC transporter permease subunit PstC [Actinomycetota bacterium]
MSARILRKVFLFCALTAVVSVVLIFIFVAVKGAPIFATAGFTRLFFSMNWDPLKGNFGMLPFIVGSFIVTLGALVLGAPLAIGTAIFLSEIAHDRIKRFIRPSVELLAGIPSVIYGFFGIILLVPLSRMLFGGSGFGLATAWIVLAIMILPTIAAISEDAISAVPPVYRMGSLALGATRWQTIKRVVIPTAMPGIVNAVVLGMGRAIGETMAVLMVLGNAPSVPKSVASPASTLTSAIALDMSYASGVHQTALFAMGLILLAVSMVLITVVRVWSGRVGR